MKLYRKVLCTERLPKKSNWYHTDWGPKYFSFDNGFEQSAIYWWLEPIEITEGEIDKMAEIYADSLGARFRERKLAIKDFTAGFKAMLSKLKGDE